MRSGAPGAGTRAAGALRNSSGRSRLVDQLVDVAHRGLLDARRGRAPVGHAAGPHLLLVDRRQQRRRLRQRGALKRTVDRLVQALAPGAEQLGQRAVERMQRARARDGEQRRPVGQDAPQAVALAVRMLVRDRARGHALLSSRYCSRSWAASSMSLWRHSAAR